MSSAAQRSVVGARPVVALVSVIAGALAVAIMHVTLIADGVAAKLLIDPNFFLYPASIQNLMWLVLFFGFGELLVRAKNSRAEIAQFNAKYLPEDERTILQAGDLGAIYNNVKNQPGADDLFLPRLIKRVILQFQSNRSVGQANALLNSSLELFLHEIDLRYNMLRYIMWLIPSLGFIGTVIGIAMALNFAGDPSTDFQDPRMLSILADKLGVAFFTTLLALLQSALLVFLIHLIQGREEKALNDAGQYCLDNLINRLYERS